MSKVLQGVIRGRTIELNAESGLSDGQVVNVIVAPSLATPRSEQATSVRGGSAGMLAGETDLDADLEEILAHRRREAFREVTG